MSLEKNLFEIITAVALWCGNPTKTSGDIAFYQTHDVNECRRALIICLEKSKKEQLKCFVKNELRG